MGQKVIRLLELLHTIDFFGTDFFSHKSGVQGFHKQNLSLNNLLYSSRREVIL